MLMREILRDARKLLDRMKLPGEMLHIAHNMKDVESKLKGAGIPTPVLTKDMQTRSLLNNWMKVRKIVPYSPLGPYYHLESTWRAVVPKTQLWDPQWSVWYTVEWWQQMSIELDDLPVFKKGSTVHLISFDDAASMAAAYGYDISRLGGYTPIDEVIGKRMVIDSVDHDFDANGRVAYRGRTEDGGARGTLLTPFFFQEFWGALSPHPESSVFVDIATTVTMEN